MYLLDTNIFITSANTYYAFCIAPGFWDFLHTMVRKRKIKSIDRVQDELSSTSAVQQWTTDNNFVFSSTAEDSVIATYGEIVRWANSKQQYNPAALDELANEKIADGWLVAYAKAYNHTVVTNEKSNKNTKKKIPIPDICMGFDVQCIELFEMMRKLGAKLR